MAGKISEIATSGSPLQGSDRFEATRDPTGTPSSVYGDLDMVAAFLAALFVEQGTTSTLSVGYSHTPHAIGTISSGTVTPDEANGAMQNYINGGAHTLAPPANSTSLHIVITNNASAGGITTSGFSVVTGDAFTTTDADVFLCAITKNGSVSHLHVTAVP